MHPDVMKAGPPPAGDPASHGMVEVRFVDGEIWRVNPALAEPAGPNETEQDRIERVHLGLDKLRGSKTPGDSAESDRSELDRVVPLVRGAAYFSGENAIRPACVQWLTDFIGFGLAVDEPNTLRIVSDSALPAARSEFDDFQLANRALVNFHEIGDSLVYGHIGLGPGVVALLTPEGHEASWFADALALGAIVARFEEQTGTPWVVIPVARNDLLLADTAADSWGELLDSLEAAVGTHFRIHPVPHMLVDGRWREHIPERLSPLLRRRLQEVRVRAEASAYDIIPSGLYGDEGDTGFMAAYDVLDVGGEVRSRAVVPLARERTSIPKVDIIDFVDSGALYRVLFADVAVHLSHLMEPHGNARPPRVVVRRPKARERTVLDELGAAFPGR